MTKTVPQEDLREIAAALQSAVEPLQGRQIFLTGGTGFFGKWLTESFLHLNQTFGLGARMTVLSRDPAAFLSECSWLKSEPALSFVKGDIRDFPFPGGRFDFVVHAATEASAKLEQERPDEMYSVIVDGTRRVLGFAAQARVSRLMMTSSGAVYGAQPTDLAKVPETFAGTPNTAYGKGKLLAEKMCAEAGNSHGFAALLPRCYAFVGPHLNLNIHFAIGNFIRDCLENRPITIQGDGTPLRSYLYASDLTLWLWSILLKGEHARPYNVGSDEAISIRDLAHQVRSLAGTDNPIEILKTPAPGVPPPRYVPSIDRARAELGLHVRCTLGAAIRRTLAWHRPATSEQRPPET